MAKAGIACHACGREAECALCAMVNWHHFVTIADFGPPAEGDTAQAREDKILTHLARDTSHYRNRS